MGKRARPPLGSHRSSFGLPEAAIKRRELKFAASAIRDLDAIYDHISDDSPRAAGKLIEALTDDLSRIADLGVSGVSREWLVPGLRLHVFGKYCVYFWCDDDYLLVSRIVHGARDIWSISFDFDFED